jgi:hypothetical protein
MNMKRLFTSFQYLCICFLCAITQNGFAQDLTLVDADGNSVETQSTFVESSAHDYDVPAYMLSANGDYYVEVPAGKHITGITFYDKNGKPDYTQIIGMPEVGQKFVISYNGSFVMMTTTTAGSTPHEGLAQEFVLEKYNGKYYIKGTTINRYLTTNANAWSSSSSRPSGYHWEIDQKNQVYNTNGWDSPYYIVYKNTNIQINNSTNTATKNARVTNPFWTRTFPFEKGSYTATVEGSSYTLNDSHTSAAHSITTNGNYVKFNISDLEAGKTATFNVTLADGDAPVAENPVVEVSTPMYTSTLRPGVNNNNVDTESQFVGIKVTPTKVTHAGSDVLSAISSEWNTLNTVLYVDMSEMNIISDADALLDDLKATVADNCLFFMPSSYKGSHANTIVGSANGTAAGDITVVDQQPFFTPYVFSTGSKKAIYERTGANGHVASQNTTLILPFDVPVANKGDLRFYTLSQIGDEDEEAKVNTVAYLFEATEVTGDAVANTPYQVKKEGEGHYTIQANNTTFRPTPEGGLVTAQNGSLTAYGNYTGVAVPKGEGILYFSQNYFWNSTTLTSSATHIKILPYRVYYKTSSQTDDSKYSVLFLTDDPEDELSEDFGNQDITAIKAMQKEDAKTVWYNMNGQKLNGRPTLPGVYVMNGKKVLIK